MNNMKLKINQTYLLFFLVISIWGLNWPIMKTGLAYISPLWFASIRVISGSAFLFLILIYKKRFYIPKAKDLPIILTVGCLQIGISLSLINLALKYSDAGQSSILAYTTPIWVTPLAVFFLKERLNSCRLLGVFFGLCGIFSLLQVKGPNSSAEPNLIANIYLILAAVLWAITIVHIRGHKWSAKPIQLMPFQMLLGGLLIIPFAFIFEAPPKLEWSPVLFFVLMYNGPLASAFCFWAYVTVARNLPATTTAIGSLGIPLVGLVSSSIFLNEHITTNKALGLAFISIGIFFVTTINNKKFNSLTTAGFNRIIRRSQEST